MQTGSMIVERKGIYDTFQDLGRMGYQASGMVVSGAMDSYSYRLGNILLGNGQNVPSLEFTLKGPTLQFTRPSLIILTGAEFEPKLNGRSVTMWRTIEVREGDVLQLGAAKRGCRGYLAIKGGFLLPNVLNSTSTYVKGKIGGWKGRALEIGDCIPYPFLQPDKFPIKFHSMDSLDSMRPLYPMDSLHSMASIHSTDSTDSAHSTASANSTASVHSTASANSTASGLKLALSYPYRPALEQNVRVRVVLGPQDDTFTRKGLSTFLNEEFQVSSQMDRMGIRLQGSPIEHKDGADIYSDSVPIGGIQVPANGQPIILMADRQTTGGYTKIGSIISVDLPKVAQLFPGNTVRFDAISVDHAQGLLRKQERHLKALQLMIGK